MPQAEAPYYNVRKLEHHIKMYKTCSTLLFCPEKAPYFFIHYQKRLIILFVRKNTLSRNSQEKTPYNKIHKKKHLIKKFTRKSTI
jgi:hypothetical protein